MLIQVIRTPANFARTIEPPLCRVYQWTPPVDRLSAEEVQEAMGRLLASRQAARRDVNRAGEPTDLVSPWLNLLHTRGLQVVAILSSGTYVVLPRARRPAVAIPSVSMADYVVAPDPCYFRTEAEGAWEPVHRLGAPCTAGHSQIVDDDRRDKVFGIWWTRDVLARDFELTIPWCPMCVVDGEPEEADEEGGHRA